LDIAKSVFQMHGVDAERGVVIRQKLTRARLLKFFESYPLYGRDPASRKAI